MTPEKLKNILEAVLLSADKPLTVIQLDALFEHDEDRPTRDEVRKVLHEMEEDYSARGFELKEVATGYRIQVKQDFAPWVSRLWEEKPARYTRALLETMALIAYRQPVTRGEIEEVRGVSVSSNIIRTLQERDWIKVLGHKDVPGKPALYGTTREFLDYFNLKSLDDLPSLAELKDLDQIYPELALDGADDVLDEKLSGDGGVDAESAELDESAEMTNEEVAEAHGAEEDVESVDEDVTAEAEGNIDNEIHDDESMEEAIDDTNNEKTAASM